MSRAVIAVVMALAVFGAGIGEARAQSAASPGRFDVAIGPLWMGGQPLGSSDANETTGTGGTFRLFSTSADLSSARVAEARVGVTLTRTLAVEAAAAYGTVPLRISVGTDSEGAAPVTATEHLHQLTVGVGVLWYVGRRRATSSRIAPFVSAEAGYLRQLHENRTFLERGHVFQAGGGVKYSLLSRTRGAVKGAGLRLDARALLRSKGVAFDDRLHGSLALGVSFFVRF